MTKSKGSTGMVWLVIHAGPVYPTLEQFCANVLSPFTGGSHRRHANDRRTRAGDDGLPSPRPGRRRAMARLQGKTAIITGAASGFGEGMAIRFAEEGAHVVVADLNEAGAERVAARIGAAAVAVTADVSKDADIRACVDAAMQLTGRVDILVNNA